MLVGATFSEPVLGSTQPSVGYRVFFLETGRPERDVYHPPHLAPWLKKEHSYTSTSTPHLSLYGLFSVEHYLSLARRTPSQRLAPNLDTPRPMESVTKTWVHISLTSSNHT